MNIVCIQLNVSRYSDVNIVCILILISLQVIATAKPIYNPSKYNNRNNFVLSASSESAYADYIDVVISEVYSPSPKSPNSNNPNSPNNTNNPNCNKNHYHPHNLNHPNISYKPLQIL